MRNIGIVAHVDAGKTSLTEQILYISGQTRKKGSVDDGTTQTDWMPIERQRGISVRSASVFLQWKGIGINLIDTPGHVDFAGEVERSLSVLDGAVLVVSAAEGIQAQTELLWEALETMKVPTLLFVNKIDRPGCEISAIKAGLQALTGSRCLFLQSVMGEGSRECSPVPRKLDELTEDLAELDDEIMEYYLDGKMCTESFLRQKISFLSSRAEAFPVLFGSMAVGVGVEELLDELIEDIPENGREDAPLSGIVYQIEHDKTMGKVAHIRLFGGRLNNRDEVLLPCGGPPQKITQIRKCSGSRQIDVGTLRAGDMGAVYGLSKVKVGDLIGEQLEKKGYSLAAALLKVQVIPQKSEELSSLVHALRELEEEDPLLSVDWEKEDREVHIRITGMIQLEVIASLLRERYQLEVSFSPPSVIYKETPSATGIGFAAYTMPKPCWAVVKFEISPLPRGSGLVYRADVPNDKLFYRYQAHIEASLRESLRQGLYGWEVTDLSVRLIDGEHHIVHTHPLDFFVATPMALMNGLKETGTTLLEPMEKARFSIPEECLPKLIGDILAMRGEFDSPVLSGGIALLEARLPVASSMEYAVALAAMSGGRGSMSLRFDGYQPCPLELGRENKRKGVNPLDRERWILYCRKALT